MKLKELLHAIPVLDIRGDSDTLISSLTFDSRKINQGSLFVAIKGGHVDGHDYLVEVARKGVSAVLVTEMPEVLDDKVVYVLVHDTAFALGVVAANFYDNPSKKLKLVGITGTNGKTTTASLLCQLFGKLGYSVGLISTIENRIIDQIYLAQYTTPDPVALNYLLSQMVEQGCDYCFMEVSSHAVVQQRIAGLHFAGGVFTNITHDHLDFHETFDNYIKAKKSFFDNLDRSAFALINVDDRNGNVMLQNTFAHSKTYALRSMADFKVKIIESHFEATLLQIDDKQVWVRLVGGFNAYNLLAVYGVAILLEQETGKVLTALSELQSAKGRFELITSEKGIVGIVDYAHTPDALENVLKTIGELRKSGQQILTVVGCGGDRDRTKRPRMAEIACILSDKVVLTSDNPRTENPENIIKDMEEGVPNSMENKVFSIVDRKEAIRAACHIAQAGDIILIAGKGHENYQEVNGERIHFDDMEILNNEFNR